MRGVGGRARAKGGMKMNKEDIAQIQAATERLKAETELFKAQTLTEIERAAQIKRS